MSTDIASRVKCYNLISGATRRYEKDTKNALLDAVNSEIVTARIYVNRTELDLINARITRLPVTLFKAAGYANYWQNLTELCCGNNRLTALNVQGLVALQVLWCQDNQLTALNVQGLAALQQLACYKNQLTELNVTGLVALQTLWCHNNQLTALNVQGLVALQTLWCHNNQLTALNVQGLVALQRLVCHNNQLTALNVQGLVALERLVCHNNPLVDLNLTGVPAVTRSEYEELEKTLLFKQLSPSNSVEARREIITRLGADYTYKNRLYDSQVYTRYNIMKDYLHKSFVSVKTNITTTTKSLYAEFSSKPVYYLSSAAMRVSVGYCVSYGLTTFFAAYMMPAMSNLPATPTALPSSFSYVAGFMPQMIKGVSILSGLLSATKLSDRLLSSFFGELKLNASIRVDENSKKQTPILQRESNVGLISKLFKINRPYHVTTLSEITLQLEGNLKKINKDTPGLLEQNKTFALAYTKQLVEDESSLFSFDAKAKAEVKTELYNSAAAAIKQL